MTELEELCRVLILGQVEFILVGGLAAAMHGSARVTTDVDIVYRRTPDNLQRIATTLAPYKPCLRGAPPGLPFKLDAQTLKRGLNFTLTTTIGAVDLLGEITGGGGYDDLVKDSEEVILFGLKGRLLNLDKLIEVKRAAGRPKDFEAIAELELLHRKRSQRPDAP